MPLVETLRDDFRKPSINARKWLTFGTVTPTQSNGELSMTTTAAAGYFGYYSASSTLDLAGSAISCKIVTPIGTTNASAEQELMWATNADNRIFLNLSVSGGVLYLTAYKEVANVVTGIQSIAYNQSTMNWWRIRSVGGTTYWEYGADGINWTTLTSQANPFTLTNGFAQLDVGQYNAEAAGQTVKFSNFNVRPTNMYPINLTTAGSSTDATSYTTASVTAPSSNLILIWVYSIRSAATPNTPIITGTGLTDITEVGSSLDHNSLRKISLFKAYGTGTAGTIGINFSGQTQTGCTWSVVQVVGATDISQFDTEATTANATSLTSTLGTFSSTDHITIAGFGYPLNSNIGSPGDYFIDIGEQNQGSPNQAMITMWAPDNQTAVKVDLSTSSTAIAGISAELTGNTTLTETKSASYSVIFTPADTTKTAEYVVNTTGPLDLTVTADYRISTTTTPTKTAQYIVFVSGDIIKTASYQVLSVATPTKTAQYLVSLTTTPTKGAGYAVRLTTTPTKSAQYVVYVPSNPNTFSWKGYEWNKRTDAGAPHYNGIWSTANIVGPDVNNHITLKLTNPSGTSPVASEIYSTIQGWGYGTYTSVVEGNLSLLHKNVVFGGLFTYDGSPSAPVSSNEIDVHETSSWGLNVPPIISHVYWRNNGGVAQAIQTSLNVPSDAIQTHIMVWQSGRLTYKSYLGEGVSKTLYKQTTFVYDIPVPNNERVHFNLWVYDNVGEPGTVDADGATAVDVKLRDFSFSTDILEDPVVDLIPFTENWTTIDTGKWNNWGGSPNVVAVDGKLRLTGSTGAIAYYGIETLSAYDLTGKGITTQVITLPTINAADTSFSTIILEAKITENNRYYWDSYVEGGVVKINAYKVIAGTYNFLGGFTYNSTLHKYFRIREEFGYIFYGYSANGSTWNELYFIATTGVAVTSLKYGQSVGNWATTIGGPYVAEFDNINLLPNNTETFTTTKTATYTVPTTPSLTRNGDYTVARSADQTKTASYVVNAITFQTKPAQYQVPSTTTLTYDGSYRLFYPDLIERDAQYLVRTTITPTVSASYSVSRDGTLTRTASYVLFAQPQVTKTAQYRVFNYPVINVPSSYEVKGNLLNKQYVYKVYNQTGTYLSTWDDVITDYQLAEEINTVGSVMEIDVPRKADDFGEGLDIDYANRVEVIVVDKEATNGLVIYTGYIAKYNADYNTDTIHVTLNSYGADLGHIVMESAGNTTIPHLSKDPSQIIKDILDAYDGDISYSSSSISMTGTTVSYTFNTNTVKEGIDKCVQLAPSGWYYYIDQATNLLHFHQLSNTPDHVIELGRNIETLHIDKSIEPVVNTLYFSGGGDPVLYKKYTIPASIANYGVRAFRYKDSRVTLVTTADIIANRVLQGSPEILVEVTIIDSNLNDLGYDIESINIGETIKIGSSGIGASSLYDTATFDTSPYDYDLTNLSSITFQVTSKSTVGDKLSLALSTTPPDITKRISDIYRNLKGMENEDNPTAPI
jgi:hypothetical protein